MPLLEVRDLQTYFPVRTGVFKRHTDDIKAVDGVSFDMAAGEIFGLVGESGCGKSTLGKTILGLHQPTAGEVRFEGRTISGLPAEAARRVRRDILATAPPTRYFISGTVRRASGAPLSGVRILLNNAPVPVATSNSSGRFTLPDRAQGTYTLSATINNTVVAVRVTLPATTGTVAPNADIVLQPKATSAAPRSGGSGGSS